MLLVDWFEGVQVCLFVYKQDNSKINQFSCNFVNSVGRAGWSFGLDLYTGGACSTLGLQGHTRHLRRSQLDVIG